MSRRLAMTCKPVDDILKHYKSRMRQHIRQYDKVRFCLSLTPEQVEILQDTLDKDTIAWHEEALSEELERVVERIYQGGVH